MECLNCKKEVAQSKGKRQRLFCNSTCRSNYWQKENRKQKAPVVQNKTQGGTQIQNLNSPSKTKDLSEMPPKSNYTINAAKPQRFDGEDALDYAFRLNEWKKSQNK